MKKEKELKEKISFLEQKLETDISIQKKLEIKDQIIQLLMEINKAPKDSWEYEGLCK